MDWFSCNATRLGKSQSRQLQVEQAEAAETFGLLASAELRVDTHHLRNITDVEQKDLHNKRSGPDAVPVCRCQDTLSINLNKKD